MPRPNPPRSIAGESALARRVAHERESRGMTYEGLAFRMTKVGCPIQASALYKIEKADPPRRITVDELVGFAQVFGTSVEQLLLPPEVAASQELAELVIAWSTASDKAGAARRDEDDAWEQLKGFVEQHPAVATSLEEFMAIWTEHHFDEQIQDEALAYWMHRITGSPEWEKRWLDKLDNWRQARGQHQQET